MSSVVEICNMALIRCGESTIASLTEPGNKGARLCNAMYEPTRDALLRSHPWNFAVRRAILARTTSTPDFEFDYEYVVPDDCLKIEGLHSGCGASWPYRAERAKSGNGRVILTNEPAVWLEYISKVTDPNQMDAAFRQALALALATAICPALTENAALTKVIAEEAEKVASEARSIDSHEGTPRDPVDDDLFVRARI